MNATFLLPPLLFGVHPLDERHFSPASSTFGVHPLDEHYFSPASSAFWLSSSPPNSSSSNLPIDFPK